MSGSTSYYQELATEDAEQYGIPTQLFLDQINQESGFNPNATNGDAVGIAQFMPTTAAYFGIDPTNPEESLNAAAEYDAELKQQTGSYAGMLNSYGTTANGDAPALATEAASYDSGTTPVSTSLPSTASSGQSSGWLSEIGSFFQNIQNEAYDIMAVVLGVVLIGSGLFLFSKNTNITVNTKS